MPGPWLAYAVCSVPKHLTEGCNQFMLDKLTTEQLGTKVVHR
jgi:hypothetical protein